MKTTLRRYFFRWIALQTVLVFLVINVVLVLFNFKEQKEHPDLVEEELEELFVVVGVMAVLLPLALFSAWRFSDRMVKPLRDLADQADRVRASDAEELLPAPPNRDEIGRLVESLNSAFDRYRHVMQRLERFSYDASHQLRNPLAALQMTGEVALRESRDAAAYAETIGHMLDDAKRLQRTVEQMLRLARTAGADLARQGQRVDLRALVADLSEEAKRIAEGSQIGIRLQVPAEPAMVKAIPELIHEALANLIDNAIRFSPSGGMLDVSLSQPTAGHWRIEISDEGPGIPAERRATLFRPFLRGPADQGGRTGLGLAIVADVCRAHGGVAGLRPGTGTGSTFWIELPAA